MRATLILVAVLLSAAACFAEDAAPKPPGISLMPIKKIPTECAVDDPFFELVSTQERFIDVWDRLNSPGGPQDITTSGPLLSVYPDVDFKKNVVLVFCEGAGGNLDGINAVECYEDDQRILLRTRTHRFQTMGGYLWLRECALFLLPRNADKTLIVQSDEQHDRSQPPIWQEVFRVPPGTYANASDFSWIRDDIAVALATLLLASFIGLWWVRRTPAQRKIKPISPKSKPLYSVIGRNKR